MPNSNPAIEKNVACLKTNGNFLQYIIFNLFFGIFLANQPRFISYYSLQKNNEPNDINARLPTKDETVRYDCKEFILFVS